MSLVNKARADAGVGALTLEPHLNIAAQAHSQDQAQRGEMSHYGCDDSDPGDRVTRAGYVWWTVGENVAAGYGTVAEVFNGWMNSAGHRWVQGC